MVYQLPKVRLASFFVVVVLLKIKPRLMAIMLTDLVIHVYR